jgi:DNA-binding GntR family transcriptional regulator
MNKIAALAFTDGGSLRAQVFKELENAILTGTLVPGDALIESHLSQELGVSRTPVREAIRQLELEGLVKSIPNRGAVVVGISERDIEDIYTIRTRIEGLAARWAAQNITDEEAEALKNIIDLQEFYLEKGDVLQIWHLDSRFHELLNESCRSNLLRHTLSSFHNYIQRARRISFENVDRAHESVAEHKKIVSAVVGGDADAAERLTIEHIINAKDNFMNHIKRA